MCPFPRTRSSTRSAIPTEAPSTTRTTLLSPPTLGLRQARDAIPTEAPTRAPTPEHQHARPTCSGRVQTLSRPVSGRNAPAPGRLPVEGTSSARARVPPNLSAASPPRFLSVLFCGARSPTADMSWCGDRGLADARASASRQTRRFSPRRDDSIGEGMVLSWRRAICHAGTDPASADAGSASFCTFDARSY